MAEVLRSNIRKYYKEKTTKDQTNKKNESKIT